MACDEAKVCKSDAFTQSMSTQSHIDYGNKPASLQPPGKPTGLRYRHLLYSLPLLALLAAGIFLMGRLSVKLLPNSKPVIHVYPGDVGTFPLKDGPWGNLEYLPISIAAPTELLNVKKTEEMPVRWLFKGYARDRLAQLLKDLNLSYHQQNQLLDPAQLEISAEGAVVNPSPEVVFNLSPKAIEGIYKILALATENNSLREAVPASILEYMTEANGVSKETVSLFKQVCWRYGDNLVCYCLPQVLASLPTYDQKNHLMKAISRQQTMLLKLWVNPDADINALENYWGKACWSTDVRALLESLAKTPGGGQLDVIELLPPLATQLLYTYPIPQNPLNGPAVKQDCMWTSMNFFREPPNPRFNDPNYILEKLKTDYFQVTTDPRFGDVIMFSTPDQKFIHSAVYLADDIVYTKNGDNPRNPWMLSTIKNLLDIYSINVAEGQKLTLYYFRNKYY